MARMTRRGILGGGVAAAAITSLSGSAGTQPAPATEDAKLIAIGREAADLIEQRKPLEARYWALPSTSGREDSPHQAELHVVSDAMQPIDERLDDLTDRALDLSATTREGMAAKAHLIRYEMRIYHTTGGQMDLAELDFHDRLTWTLLHDLLGEAI